MNPKHQSILGVFGCERSLKLPHTSLLLFLAMLQLSAEPDLHHLTYGETGDSGSQIRKGWLLVNEMGCFQCHDEPNNFPKKIPSFDAPDLGNVHSRLSPDFVYQFVQNPEQFHPGTRMPDVMNHLTVEQKEEAARHITAYLWQHQATPRLNEAISKKDTLPKAREGYQLFNSIGCFACHPSFGAHPLSVPASLKHVGNKYLFEGLKNFLLSPQEIRRGYRMPDFKLTDDEAEKLSSYLMQDSPNKIGQKLDIELGKPELGRVLFNEFSCSNCHRSSKTLEMRSNNIPIPPPDSLSNGCLAESPPEHSPRYGLSSLQKDLIRSALRADSRSTDFSEKRTTEDYLTLLKCNACHERIPLPGPHPGTIAHFATSGEDLGDEGRIPPRLNGVGRKLTRKALRKTILGEFAVRPYMDTRMPNWGIKHAERLTELLARSDEKSGERPTPRLGQENQVGRNMWGRALMGTGGLGCIQCHPLNGNQSLGIRAMDLVHVAQRLRAPWFRDYLLNPAEFRPGTRMPSFWPDGKPSISGQGGSTERQIDSIWVYLNELDQSRLPEGMESKGNFILKPEHNPIVFRTFIEGAGLHAIAVGSPLQYHVAFDSKSCRWHLAWYGPFLDAESTWDDRFTPLTPALGKKLPWFPTSKNLWIWDKVLGEEIALKANPRFSGYRLNKEGIPSFHYKLHDMEISDQVEAIAEGLHRRVRFENSGRNFRWLILESSDLTQINGKRFKTGDSFFINILEGTTEIVKKENQMQFWMIPTESGFEYTITRGQIHE